MTKLIEYIDADLAPIIPRFMSNSNQELHAMFKALEEEDYALLRRLGHNAKGAGFGYGFKGMGEIGRRVELAARETDSRTCRLAVEELKNYLEHVQIKYQN